MRAFAADPQYTDVFIGDKMPEKAANPEGYHTFRIPAIVTAANGDLLAFCEGRRDSAADNGKIDIVMKRSTDGGATWGPLQFVYGKPDVGTTKYTIGNPVPIVDRTTGAILLLFCENNRFGLNITRSFDHGATWTTPTNINLIGNVPPKGSTTVPAVNYAALTKATGNDVQNFATGPGHGLQLANGRFVVPMWFTSNLNATPVWTGPKIDQALLDTEGLIIPRDPTKRFFSGLLVSDDGGNWWRIGALSAEGSNESIVTQLPDGTLVMSSRFEAGNYRVISRSNDGGDSFSSVTLDRRLIDIGCQGSILVWPGPGGTNYLAHSNAAIKGLNSSLRANVTIRLSTDGGTTWNQSRVIDPGKSAYSDLVTLNDGNLGILYEQGVTDYRDRITFAKTTFEWLLTGSAYHSWIKTQGLTGTDALPDGERAGDV